MVLSRAFFPRTKVTHSPADLRNTLTFPSFEDLPDENDIDDRYYSLSPYTSIYRPHRHWCFLGEIGDEIGLMRLGLEVCDTAGARIPVFFHTDDRGSSFAGRCRKGATLAVLYSNRHDFLDMSVGLRIEDAESVSVLPFSMEELSEANALMWDSVSGSERKVEDRLCGGCEKGGDLRACSQCKLAFYCGTECQTKAWKDGHKRICKAVQALEWFKSKKWETFEGDYFSWSSLERSKLLMGPVIVLGSSVIVPIRIWSYPV